LLRVVEEKLGAEADHAGGRVEPGAEQQRRRPHQFLLIRTRLARGQAGQQVIARCAPAPGGHDRGQPVHQLLARRQDHLVLPRARELLEDAAGLTCQPAEPDRLVVVDIEQAAKGQRRERDGEVLYQVDGGIAGQGETVDQQVGDALKLGPVVPDVPRHEMARRHLPPFTVTGAGTEHHRPVQAVGERVLPPVRLQRIQMLPGRRAERRLAQQPRAAGKGADQIALRHPREPDRQERRQVAEPGVQRIGVGQRARADQLEEDPQRLRIGALPGVKDCHAGPQKFSSALAVGSGCSMFGLCAALSMTIRSASRTFAMSA
jgi:hypothetical protein